MFAEVKSARAFTLIELLVVVLIIGILAAIAVPSYQTAVEKSRAAEMFANLKALKNAYEIFYLEYGRYPNNNEDLPDIDVQSNSNVQYVVSADGPWAVRAGKYSLEYVNKNYPAVKYQNQILCDATVNYQKICVSLGGVYDSRPNSTPAIGNSAYRYILK